VFIDETWTRTNMAPLRGWGPRGRRLVAKAPHGTWRTLTFLAALRCDRIAAPCVIDGPITGPGFLAWVEQVLVPTLAPGDIDTMDLEDALCEVDTNCGKLRHGWLLCSGRQHPNYGAIRRREQEPSTPSIEQAFAKLKHLMRQAAERSVEATWRRIGTLLDHFTPAECANYLINAGYAST
jgi:hypothetical protein